MKLILFWFLLGANKLFLHWPFLNNGYKRRRHPTRFFFSQTSSNGQLVVWILRISINEKDSYLGVYSFSRAPLQLVEISPQANCHFFFNLELAVKLPPNNMTGTFEGTAAFNSYHSGYFLCLPMCENLNPQCFSQLLSAKELLFEIEDPAANHPHKDPANRTTNDILLQKSWIIWG